MKEEYLIDLNATQAAIRAGYKIDSARDIGCENLTKPNIAEEIEKALAERSRRTVFGHRHMRIKGHGYTHKSDYFMDWVANGWQRRLYFTLPRKESLDFMRGCKLRVSTI